MHISFFIYVLSEIFICIGLFYIYMLNRKTTLKHFSLAVFTVALLSFLGIITFYTSATTSSAAICSLQSCDFPFLYTAIYIFTSISGAFGLFAAIMALANNLQRKAN